MSQKQIDPSDVEVENIRFYFSDICSTEKYIYALYEDEDSERKRTNSILVFDWNGEPVCRMQIRKALSIAVDERNRRIIAVNDDDTPAVCVEYDLPAF